MRSLSAALTVLAAVSVAIAQERPTTGLKTLPPSQHVASLRYCCDVYDVALKGGTVRPFKEYDLPFKTDAGANGPDRSMRSSWPAAAWVIEPSRDLGYVEDVMGRGEV